MRTLLPTFPTRAALPPFHVCNTNTSNDLRSNESLQATEGRPYFQVRCGVEVCAVLQLSVRPRRLSLSVRVRRAKVTYSCRWKSCRGK
jgi:hypothetical protein